MAEVVSTAVTILLVALCVWLLRGTKSFSALQGNHSETKLDEEVMPANGVGVEDSALGQEQIGLRRRVGKFFGRNPIQSEASAA